MNDYRRLCSDCMETSQLCSQGYEYIGLTLSLPGHCTECGKTHAGRFEYVKVES